MERPITGFGIDDEGDPFAWLSCGHRQHVRHQPPFVNRPWVMDEAGRAGMLGKPLNCVRCDAMEWPDNFYSHQQTPPFTEATIPAGLLKDHSTKAGVWAKIIVHEGHLRYRIPSLGIDQVLTPDTPGIVLPEILHSVEPLGAVQFLVQFYKMIGT